MSTIYDWQKEAGYDDTQTLEPSYIVAFKKKARDWAEKVIDLNDTEVRIPALVDKKSKLMKWAGIIRKGVESITGTIDELENAGIAALPAVVPVATVALSLAAITKWTTDYLKFKDAVALQNDLIDGGTSPKTANEMVSKLVGGKSLVSMNAPTVLGAVLVIAGSMFAANTLRK